jgi:hypothetical protein
MSREQAIDARIKTPVQEVPYPDQQEISGGLCQRMMECFMQRVTGAGGAGGSALLCPFQPAIVEVVNALGATPRYNKSYFGDGVTAQHISIILATAANANPPTLTRVAANNWTIGIPTQLAPDGEAVYVVCYGFRVSNGSI